MEFVEPVRCIKTLSNLAMWSRSKAYRDYMSFVCSLNDSVKTSKVTDDCHISDATQKICAILAELSSWVDEIKPHESAQRFGNKAYRDWWKRLDENSEKLLLELLPDDLKSAVVELKPYLKDAFGNCSRIDYGTGHEANFVILLCCLQKLKVLTAEDNKATVTVIFNMYLDICRKLQTEYRMEPAGSQGVWGLDDFQFLPYVWGSAQLLGNEQISPDSIPNEMAAERYHSDYMLFGCTKNIFSVKSGPFGEHSNVLWNISSVPAWVKVNSGLLKMYQAEVLSKFPVVQHFVFGSLMSIDKAV